MDLWLSGRRFLLFVREHSGLRDHMKTQRYGARDVMTSKQKRDPAFL